MLGLFDHAMQERMKSEAPLAALSALNEWVTQYIKIAPLRANVKRSPEKQEQGRLMSRPCTITFATGQILNDQHRRVDNCAFISSSQPRIARSNDSLRPISHL
jgi:hypothetical protein